MSFTADVEDILDYQFTNVTILHEALSAAGSPNALRYLPDGNKRLAIVGDAAIQLILAQKWYESPDGRGELIGFRILNNTKPSA